MKPAPCSPRSVAPHIVLLVPWPAPCTPRSVACTLFSSFRRLHLVLLVTSPAPCSPRYVTPHIVLLVPWLRRGMLGLSSLWFVIKRKCLTCYVTRQSLVTSKRVNEWYCHLVSPCSVVPHIVLLVPSPAPCSPRSVAPPRNARLLFLVNRDQKEVPHLLRYEAEPRNE